MPRHPKPQRDPHSCDFAQRCEEFEVRATCADDVASIENNGDNRVPLERDEDEVQCNGLARHCPTNQIPLANDQLDGPRT
jgi:NAD-dependent dihydropyrimidine dehydrogenase PreA subunit